MTGAPSSKVQPKKTGNAANLTNAGKGRPKGTPNKNTALAKEAIALAFDQLGGTDALVEWAKTDADTRKVFYSQIWTKILPLQITGGEEPIKIEITRRIVGGSTLDLITDERE